MADAAVASANAALGKANADWKKRHAELNSTHQYAQEYLKAFAGSLAELAELGVDVAPLAREVRGFAVEQDRLAREVTANDRTLRTLTPADVLARLPDADVAPETKDNPSEALLATLRRKLEAERAALPESRANSADIIKLLPGAGAGAGAAGAGQGDDDDDDIIVENGEVNFTCPITRKPFVDPVKNRACGHSYSRAAIYEVIARARRGRGNACPCPVAGCQKTVSKANLVDDVALAFAMQRQSRVDAAKAAATAADAMDEEEEEEKEEEEEETAVIL